MKKKTVRFHISKKSRGFTIIELFAIIGILAILAILVFQNILNLYRKAQVESFKTSVKSIAKSVDNYIFNKGDIPESGINVSELDITNKRVYSGKFIKNENGRIEADNVSDGVFCAKGELENLYVEKGCENLDTTAPINLVIVVSNKTSGSLTVVGNADDEESTIVKYEFKIDDGTHIDKGIINTHTFGGLTSGNHIIYMRVTNGKGMTSEEHIEVTLEALSIPTYSINPEGWSISKTLTITYPNREEGYVYDYSTDGGETWTLVENKTTAEVIFNNNGMLIGRVSDGVNIVSSSQMISQIDNSAPNINSVTIDANNINSSGFTITRNGNATDEESGLATNPYIYQISTDATSWITKCTNNETSCAVSGLTPVTLYHYRICVVDKVNNESCSLSKTTTTISAVYTFEYTGAIQNLTAPVTGKYKIESYGAQGAGPGGKGGYATGEVYLNSGNIIEINVGGQNGYNGGGSGTYNGGGSSTIKLGSTTLLIAAGGGGGAMGTAGGNGTGSGGAGSVGTGYNSTTAPSPYTLVNGTSGTSGGGGGSGNKYKNCTGYTQVYNSCKTTQNTCSYGCDSVYDPCATTIITNPRTTSCSICGYYCSSGTKQGSTCKKTCTTTYMSSTVCLQKCGGNCNGSTCSYDCSFAAECATCYPDTVTCVAGWVDRNCSSCYYGSPNSCVSGYDNGACNAFSAEAYNSGNGGSNVTHASLSNTSSQNGSKEGNGRVLITYIGG